VIPTSEFIFTGLSVFILLVLIGEPLRLVIKSQGPFQNLDFIEILFLNLTLGSALLYLLGWMPGSLFTFWSIILLLIVGVSFTIITLLRIEWLKISKPIDVIVPIIIIFFFLMLMVIQSMPLTQFLNGNIHDVALHELFAKVIVQNYGIPKNLEPYSSETIIYPQGFHVLLAFSYLILKVPPGTLAHILTPLFQSLPVLAGYSLGKRITKSSTTGLWSSFVFCIISRWPRLLTWGALPYMFGISVFLFFIPYVMFGDRFENLNQKNFFFGILGLILGYIGAISFVTYQILLGMMWINIVFKVRFNKNNKNIYPFIKRAFLISICSIIPLLPSILRFLYSLSHPGLNMGLPLDVNIEALGPISAPISLLEFGKIISRKFLIEDWITPYPLLSIITIMTIIITSFFVVKQRSNPVVNKAASISFYGIITGFMILILTSKEISLFPSKIISQLVNPSETIIIVWVLFLVPITILLKFLYNMVISYVKEETRIIAIMSLLCVIVITPYVYYVIIEDGNYITGQNNIFCILSLEDKYLMSWISNNTSENIKILVNPYETGSFIPVLANRVIVYPFTATRRSESYKILVNLINKGILNETTYQLAQQHSVTHVYVGPLTFWDVREKWDPSLFNKSQNFRLEKRIGSAYLFRYIVYDE
jgi:hypothetical protein